jgi:integrase
VSCSRAGTDRASAQGGTVRAVPVWAIGGRGADPPQRDRPNGGGAEIVIQRGLRIRPVEAVQAWLQAAGVSEGLLVPRRRHGRQGQAARAARHRRGAVKRYAEAAGLDPVEFSGHSLRAGFVTSAAESGASILRIQEVSRHRSVDVLSGYVRRVDLFRDHAGAGFL